MSTSFSDTTADPLLRPGRSNGRLPQSNSWPVVTALVRLLFWADRRRERAALRDLANDQRLLDDIGLTQRQALLEANKPFWR
jgi:uncharacterized protein YjiS (DUF1127 family)